MDTGVDERGVLFVGDDAPDDDADIIEPGCSQLVHQLRDEEVIGRQRRNPDHVDILVDDHRAHRVQGLSRSGVDNFHPRISQEPGDQATAPIMAVQPDLGYQDPYHYARRAWSGGLVTALSIL